ncbi:MAG: TIGR00730 family Rossman fold protein [Acidimicrobiia bacterium]|nr:TIGR00730 family Rossman fold protein [Acidimicrobiia bacterium]
MADLRRICVFCGSSAGSNPAFSRAAGDLGAALADRSIELVYGGGATGLMGTVADAVLGHGGHVVGIIPGGLSTEVGHPGISQLIEVEGMHARKALMYDKADAFVALPGGFGTLDELAEVLTWSQLGLHTKPVGLLDVEGYFGSLLAFLDGAVDAGLLKDKNRALLLSDTSVGDLLDTLATTEVTYEPKWQ